MAQSKQSPIGAISQEFIANLEAQLEEDARTEQLGLIKERVAKRRRTHTGKILAKAGGNLTLRHDIAAKRSANLRTLEKKRQGKPGQSKRTAKLHFKPGRRNFKVDVTRVMAILEDTVRSVDARILIGVDPAIGALIEPLSRAVKARRAELTEQNIQKLVEVMLPANDPLADVTSALEADNAELRVQFMRTVRCFDTAELAESAGHTSNNKSATGTRWKASRKVFSVPHNGKDYYPAFQFEDGRPRPVIARVLSELPHLSHWQTAFWFVSSNPWLDGKAPYQLLANEADILRAAEHLKSDLVG